MRSFCLAFCASLALGVVPSASFATNGNDQDQAQGQGQDQGQAQGQAQGQVAFGGDSKSSVDTDVRNTVDTSDVNVNGQSQTGTIKDNFSNNTTVVNPNVRTDIDSSDFRRHAESAAEVDATESGCHTGASAQTGVFGGSVGGSSVACDGMNTLRTIRAAEAMGEVRIANIARRSFYIRSVARSFLTIFTLGLL